ncbi:hypothetical protein [Streptomyces sp. NPDC005046]
MTTYTPKVTDDGAKLCGVKSCDRRHEARGLCHAHYHRLAKHGDVQPDKPLGKARGRVRAEQSPRWAGDDVTYLGAHRRIAAEHGKAADWKCACGCGKPAAEWAYLGIDTEQRAATGGRHEGVLYSPSSEHYAPLAKVCHARFDVWQRQRRTGLSLASAVLDMLTAS